MLCVSYHQFTVIAHYNNHYRFSLQRKHFISWQCKLKPSSHLYVLSRRHLSECLLHLALRRMYNIDLAKILVFLLLVRFSASTEEFYSQVLPSLAVCVVETCLSSCPASQLLHLVSRFQSETKRNETKHRCIRLLKCHAVCCIYTLLHTASAAAYTCYNETNSLRKQTIYDVCIHRLKSAVYSATFTAGKRSKCRSLFIPCSFRFPVDYSVTVQHT